MPQETRNAISSNAPETEKNDLERKRENMGMKKIKFEFEVI
ncbi:hypothetical protein SynMVIR181_01569 [Synechococcus sp. MVIR-18-1]|nr:hypothetical protein SynMVIR181_01569 [Synechococcus sp. MVIR-18-1]